MELLLLWSSHPHFSSFLTLFSPICLHQLFLPSSSSPSSPSSSSPSAPFSSHTLMEPKSSSTMKAMEPKLSFKERVLPKKETSSIAYDFEDEDENDVGDDYRYDGKVMFKEDNGINKKKKTVATVSGGRSGGGSGGVVAGVGSPCCQAEKCGVDLTDAKRYHRRHKVCEVHAKAPAVEVAGLRQRFCQQCSRFHELSEFDEAKRSCRRRLAGHNERRRKGVIEPQNGEGSGGKEKENHWRQAEERTAAIVEINPSYKHLQIR